MLPKRVEMESGSVCVRVSPVSSKKPPGRRVMPPIRTTRGGGCGGSAARPTVTANTCRMRHFLPHECMYCRITHCQRRMTISWRRGDVAQPEVEQQHDQ